MISIVIPAHNEELNLRPMLEKTILSLNSTNFDYEIILVNDNSTDKTEEIATQISRLYDQVKVINRLDGNKGVGITLRTGYAATEGDIVVTIDADLSQNPEDIPRLVKAVNDGADFAIGSRYVKGGSADLTIAKKILSRLFNFVAGMLIGLNIRDVTHGFRAIRKEVLDQIDLESSGFVIYPELTLNAYFGGFKLTEVPVILSKRKSGVSKMVLLHEGSGYIGILLKAIINRVKYFSSI